MVAAITSSELAQMEPKMILPAKLTLQAKTLATQLFHKETLPKGQGRVLNQPKYGEFEAYDAVEGVEVDNPQKLTTTNFVVEPTEVVAQFLLTDVAARVGGENHMRQAGRILGEAMAKRVDKKGWSVIKDGDARGNQFTTALGVIGGASPSTTITVGHITAAIARLEGASEPVPKPIRAVMRAEQLRLILNNIVPFGSTPIYGGLSEEVIRQYLRHDFKLFGIDGAFISPNIDRISNATVGDANTYAVGTVFSEEAVWYVPADSVNVEKERRMKARSWLYQTSHTFGFGIYNGNWGIKMQFAAVDPTT